MAAGGSDLTWQTQRVDGGTIFVQSGGSRRRSPDAILPQVTLAVEHYNRMVRLLEHNVPVKVELNVEVKFREETQPSGFNVVGEIPGTDKADEIVLIGAHFDSWHGAHGRDRQRHRIGRDDGSAPHPQGDRASAAPHDSHRPLGRRRRRPARIAALCASTSAAPQRGGGAGAAATRPTDRGAAAAAPSRACSTEARAAEDERVLQLDNGTGKIRGIWMQGNAAVKPIFEAWIKPLKDLGVEILGPRSVPQTDHTQLRRARRARRSSSCRNATSTTRGRTTRTWTSSIACRPTT